jgi:hypothetical protein
MHEDEELMDSADSKSKKLLVLVLHVYSKSKYVGDGDGFCQEPLATTKDERAVLPILHRGEEKRRHEVNKWTALQDQMPKKESLNH